MPILVLLLAVCTPGPDPAAPDAPLTIHALDVGHPTSRFRGIRWICAEGR